MSTEDSNDEGRGGERYIRERTRSAASQPGIGPLVTPQQPAQQQSPRRETRGRKKGYYDPALMEAAIRVDSRLTDRQARAQELDEEDDPPDTPDVFNVLDEVVAFPDPDKNTAIRVRDLYGLHRKAGREFILHTVHRLLLARVPLDEIAKEFGVNVNTVWRWKAYINRRLREKANEVFDVKLAVMEHAAHYDALVDVGWRTIAGAKDTTARRHGAEIVRGALGDKMKLFQVAGAFDKPVMIAGVQEDKAMENADLMRGLAHEFLGGIRAIKGRMRPMPGDEIIDDPAPPFDPLTDELDVEGEEE